MSKKESEVTENEEKGSSGIGLGTAVLVGAAAAGIGFMARDIWGMWTESRLEQEQANRPRSPQNMQARKNMRSRVHEENVSEDMKCVVCWENPKEIILMPCAHVCICEDCAEKIQNKCPVCRRDVYEKKPAYVT